jgi:hypothetical protein
MYPALAIRQNSAINGRSSTSLRGHLNVGFTLTAAFRRTMPSGGSSPFRPLGT